MPHHQLERRPWPWRAPRRPGLALAALALLALTAAACGGSGGSGGSRVASLAADGGSGTTTTTSPDPEDAALAFVRCMRQHGVDMPDPKVESGGRMRLELPRGPRASSSQRKLKEAEAACGHLLKPRAGSKRLDPAFQDALVNFARCMREHGIDMPDPTPGQGGLLVRKSGADSAKFKEAERACDHFIKDKAPERAR